MTIDPRAGTLVEAENVLDVSKAIQAFFNRKPDILVAAQRVKFGTSGHRGSAFDTTFNEDHILAITQAICRYRASQGIDGPLFLGRDTHALSQPAFQVALEVLVANGVTVMIDDHDGYTPTPVISHAILTHNKSRTTGLADGIVITPSHNPPQDGGFKYNPPHGGPAESGVTSWIENTANGFLKTRLVDVRRLGVAKGHVPNLVSYDYVNSYVSSLDAVVEMQAIRAAGLRIGIDPLGGAAVHYWGPVAEKFGLNITVTDTTVDPTFRSIPRDWDGNIRMDCSSPYPMKRLLAQKDAYDIAFANDTDADRHGIVSKAGLMPPNDYLAVCASYLGRERPAFKGSKIGKTVVSSSMIDRVAQDLGAALFEVPVGFKWFVEGLHCGGIYFCGEESAGSSFLRRDGSVWTTDKDGLIAGLLAAEITARSGKTPDILFDELTAALGKTFYARQDNPANESLRTKLGRAEPADISATELGGDVIREKITNAPGNDASIGGIKLSTDNGWVAARPSGTEDVYKIYAESFVSAGHLAQLQTDTARILQEL
jgi:phosphoglucomutase